MIKKMINKFLEKENKKKNNIYTKKQKYTKQKGIK